MFPSRVTIAEGVGQVIFLIPEGRQLANAVTRYLEEKRGVLPSNVGMSIRLEEDPEGFTLSVTLEHLRPPAIAFAAGTVMSLADTARWLWRLKERERSPVGSRS